MQTQSAFEFCQRPVRTPKSEHLVFAAMPDENGVFAIGEAAERYRAATGIEGTRLKPLIALQRLPETAEAVTFGAKLAGQAVPAAGLMLKFDTIATVQAERRVLALTSSDPAVAALHEALGTALQRHRLRCDSWAPFLPLFYGAPRIAPEKIKPVKIKITGLALLRGEAAGDFQVLRRWPLNTATNRNLTGRQAPR